MAKITAIEPQKRSPERVNIHLDGEYAFSLARIVAAWLRVGQDINEEKTASLQAEDAREQAYQQALLLLSYRPRSESEIRKNLRKHELPEEAVEQALERLKGERLVDDQQFARVWVDNRNTFRPRSRRALSFELRQKGLSDEAAQSALKDVDDETLAYQAGLKKAYQLKSVDRDEFRRKLSGFLSRRGFSYTVLAPVVARLWNETHPDNHLLDDEEVL